MLLRVPRFRFSNATPCIGALVALAIGCQQYHPLPLNDQTVNQALTIPPERVLQLRAAQPRNPLLEKTSIDLRQGVTPEQAMALAIILNPTIRAQRSRLALSQAQLFQAGILPNPQLDFTLDPVTGGMTAGTVTAYNVGLSWEITSLITHDVKVASARNANAAVRLDVAWQEWQLAQAARQAVYDSVALRAELDQAREIDRLLRENVELLRRAVNEHQRTVLDLAAAEGAFTQSHSIALGLERDVKHQHLALLQAMGFPPDATIDVNPSVALPTRLAPPSAAQLLENLAARRLDLVALQRGYESQDQTVRAAILAQFPKILLGVHEARDNTDVQSTGFGVTIDLPIFDRNQGTIAAESATRQKLFDEYVARIFESRAAIVAALVDVASLNEQIADAQQGIPALQRLVSTYKTALDQHNADVISYYTAVNSLAQKRLDLLKLQQQLAQAMILLDIAAGTKLALQPAGPASNPSPTTEPAP